MDYEFVYILIPKFSEKEARTKAKEVSDLLKKRGAKILKEDFWGKRELAYPIKHFEEGWYILVEFSSEPEKIREIDKALKLEEDIIRFLIIKKEKKEAVKEKISKVTEAEEKKKVKKTTATKKIGLEKLDEKLEEILD